MFKKENLRKNFLRVKQNIDQNLGRSEKSEVLSEDQQENEKRVDVVKHVFQNISKKAGAVLQAQGSDFDKRLKKLPETALGHALTESAQALNTESLLGVICHLCGECQTSLAKDRVLFETEVEHGLVKSLNNVVEVDIPGIIKQRKILNKSILDMDSAKSRFNQAVRQSSVPGANMSNAASKVDVIREEYDDALSKVETNKDNLSIELCHFMAKESDHASMLLGLLEAQANYHRSAFEAIETFLPRLRVAIEDSPAKPCYGMPLEEHLRLTGRDIAVVLEACIVTLMEIGLEEEGLFRVAGSANKVKKLKASFDAFPFDANALDVMVQDYCTDPFAVAGALKQYLRELPEPLLTYALHDDFMHAVTLPPEQRLQTLWVIINSLPTANYNNFRYLIKFLAKLKDKSDINKMKASNIAIVVGPNLLWSEGTDSPSMSTTGTLSTVIEAVVTHSDYFFPGECDFHKTSEGSSPKPPVEPPKIATERVVERKASLLQLIQPQHKGPPSETKKSFDPTSVSRDIKRQNPNPSDSDSSSSDECNPFSSKFEARAISEKSSDERIQERGHTLPTESGSSYDTGDYDNIMFTSHNKSPLYRSSTVTNLYPLKNSSNTTSDDSLDSGHARPIRPSRPSKKSLSPGSSLSKSYTKTSAYPSFSQSESPLSSGTQSVNKPLHDEPKQRTGSSPNISVFHQTGQTDSVSSQDAERVFWNRPNLNSDTTPPYHSLKRGSAPSIITPPPNSSLVDYHLHSHHRTGLSKISRSQLGQPPPPKHQTSNTQSVSSEMTFSTFSKPAVAMSRPMDKSVHGSSSGTTYPLSSQGAGNKTNDYSTKVQAMWDDISSMSCEVETSPGPVLTTFVKANESLRKEKEIQKKVVDDGASGSAFKVPSSDHSNDSSTSARQELDFNVHCLLEDHEKTGPHHIHNTSTEMPSIQVPSPGPYQQPPSPKSSSPASLSVSVPSDGSEATSPIQRRGTRKPAPPPPPERPFNVIVTAATSVPSSAKLGSDGSNNYSSSSAGEDSSSNNSGNSSLTWPRSAPLASPESPTDMPVGERHRLSGHMERPNIPPPERPKLPPPIAMSPAGRGHQRSASTGAMMMNTNANNTAVGGEEGMGGGGVGVPNAGTVSPSTLVPGGDGLLSANDLTPHTLSTVAPGMSNTLGRTASLRPRPSPPPPPPPIAKESEDTKL